MIKVNTSLAIKRANQVMRQNLQAAKLNAYVPEVVRKVFNALMPKTSTIDMPLEKAQKMHDKIVCLTNEIAEDFIHDCMAKYSYVPPAIDSLTLARELHEASRQFENARQFAMAQEVACYAYELEHFLPAY